jgi:hypothetical protein
MTTVMQGEAGREGLEAELSQEELMEAQRRLDEGSSLDWAGCAGPLVLVLEGASRVLEEGDVDEAREARVVARVAARLHPLALAWLAERALDEPQRRRRALLEVAYRRCASYLALVRWRG